MPSLTFSCSATVGQVPLSLLTLGSAHRWFWETLPSLISGRDPPHIVGKDLVTLVRPQAQDVIPQTSQQSLSVHIW